VIVSLDLIKVDRLRDQFLRDAPDLVIVDGAGLGVREATLRSAACPRYEFNKPAGKAGT
jgi:hypothetical protein